MTAEHMRLANTRVQPDCALSLEANRTSQQQMSTASSLADILRRPHIHYRFLDSASHLGLSPVTRIVVECFVTTVYICSQHQAKWTILA